MENDNEIIQLEEDQRLAPAVEVITDQIYGCTLCHILRATYSPGKTTFFTPGAYSQQLGIIVYGKDNSIKPHYHNEVKREVSLTQEVLIIRKGKVMVDIYDLSLNHVASRILYLGDVILLASGGHGFKMMEDSEILEVKQGPYSGVQNDKTIF